MRIFRRKDDGEAPPPEDTTPPAATTPEPVVAAASGEDEAAVPVDQAIERTRRTWFGRIGGMFRRGLSDELWDELEETMIAADTGVATTLKVIGDLKERVRSDGIRDPEAALEVLKDDLVAVLEVDTHRGQIWHSNGQQETLPKPAVILVVGVNGTGKTTSIGKLAYAYKAQGKKLVLAAGDTFRAAAIEQLKHWGERAGVDVVAHQQGADPGAVVFDAMQAAEKRDADVVIIDTAGRLHTKAHLMEELRKVNRIIQRQYPEAPHEVLLVIDATTGQNAMTQAKYFTEAVGVTGIVLAKLDGTAKGGVVFSIIGELEAPILFVGTGEKVDDISEFDPERFVAALFSAN